MINTSEIERLAHLHTEDGVLSATIKIDPQLGYERNQPAMKFKGAYARAARHAVAPVLTVLQREHDRVLEFLKDYKPAGRGLVIYSSTPADIWEVIPLDVMVPTLVSAGSTPDTTALARVVDEYPRMAVVLLDGGDARIYAAEQGRQQKTAHTNSDLPSRQEQGGWSQARYERHVEFHYSMHLKDVAEKLLALARERPFDRLVLVGVEGATAEFESLLPEPVRQRLAGRLTADFKQEGDDAILARARQLCEEDERSAEIALVDRVRGLAEAEGRGALGIDDSLQALVEGRVDTLVVADGMTQDGTLCLNCDYFAASKFKRCPACSNEQLEDLPDAIEYAVARAMLSGSQVNILFNGGREMLLARGGIGAILRYALPAASR